MKIFDFIFAFITGIFVAWVANDFTFGKYFVFLFIFFPLFSVLCLFIAELIAKKYKFVIEMARFVLVGGFADIIDIKLFLIIFYFLPSASFVKAITFLVAVAIKYIGNRNWTFTKNENAVIKRELSNFLYVTAVGLFINVIGFYCATLLTPNTKIWIEINIIIAALLAAIWNFLGYKLIVFKNK